MKTNRTVLVAILAASFMLTACTHNNSTEKGVSIGLAKGVMASSTGLYTVNDGLTLKDSYLAVDDRRVGSNEVEVGDKIAVVFEGVEGFKEVNGKVFPELTIVVTDMDGNILLLQEDLLKSDTGYDAKDASVLSGTLLVGDPLAQGQEYLLTVNINDKEGAGTLAGSITLKIK